jgi:hypothetical protein
MKYPIVEFRQKSLFILMNFDAKFQGDTVRIRHNFAKNKTLHIVDSNTDLWSFQFVRTDHLGVRKLLSTIWNISSDYYKHEKSIGISISQFRNLLEPYTQAPNPDSAELAKSLLDSVAKCPPSDNLHEHIHLLNL